MTLYPSGELESVPFARDHVVHEHSARPAGARRGQGQSHTRCESGPLFSRGVRTKAKAQAEQVQAPPQLAVIRAFETVIRGTFGNSADVLADSGLAPPKVPVTWTAEEKAVSAAKERGDAGTTGKNQEVVAGRWNPATMALRVVA